MPRLKVTHVKEQGVDLIIIPLAAQFGLETLNDQRTKIDELQLRASGAGLVGTVVPVWTDAFGRMMFLAPDRWHPFFGSISYEWVLANVNRELFW